ncbi:amidohydrolase family protein [Pseudomarimonas salicorniae]|uniref:Amidohydrolase family protein n=1 Tax=Pseudomarimonas salicorniae TaxID=2933270 RepID=A0ABT0GEQ7_9GAMM|nr:amidohydrolase family protein [Lysobacter sp. CAU 1642]MCK7593030.1 amidohydrolase family protein [Lysobacter sp. CAU 1642]
MRACLLILLALMTTSAEAIPVVLHDVTLIPMDSERSVPGQSVLVRNGRIVEIAEAANYEPPADALHVEGKGRWLMPGLAEMHAHIPPVSQQAALRRVLELFVSQGVTTARGVLGEPGHLALRDELARGERIGPRLFTSGPSLNGNSVKDPLQGREAVLAQKQAGYDLIKLHPGLSAASYQAIMAAAREQSMPVTGHVSAEVGLMQALQEGQHCIEHLDDYVRALAPDDSPARTGDPGFFGLNAVAAADAARIPRLVAATHQAGTAVTPTETLMVNLLGRTPLDALLQRPEVRYVPASTREQWRRSVQGARSEPGFDAAAAERFLSLRRDLLKALHDGGVPVLLGSDAPQVFNVPGFSSHREMALMVEAGLTPYQALRTGTVVAAEHLGVSREQGRIAVGQRADLVLLAADPLEDIAHASRIEGVMSAGRWYDRAALDALLARIEAEVAE